MKVPSVACWAGCPGAGNVVDWAHDIPKKRGRMYNEDGKVLNDIGKERKERKERKKGAESAGEEIRK